MKNMTISLVARIVSVPKAMVSKKCYEVLSQYPEMHSLYADFQICKMNLNGSENTAKL